jgi:polysaccharide pyruvyl transferase WcaK-like protein
MNKYLVHGGYYSKNFGDYLLIKKTIDEIKVIDPNCEVGLAMAPSNVSAEFKNISSITIKDLLAVKKVVFTGGGYLGERDYKILKWSILCLYRQILLPFLCILFNKEYAYFGVEVGPLRFRFLRYLTGKALSKAKYVYVRNNESFQLCMKIMDRVEHLELVTDFAQNKKYLQKFSEQVGVHCDGSIIAGKKIIGIHVTKYSSNYDLLIPYLNKLLTKLAAEGYKFVFFTDSPAHDNFIEDPSFIFSDFYDHELMSFIKYQGPENTALLLSKFNAVITSKLHVGIVSVTMGSVPLSLPSHNKTVRYYKQIRHPELCLYQFKSLKEVEYKLNAFCEKLSSNELVNIPEEIETLELNLNKGLSSFLIGKQ